VASDSKPDPLRGLVSTSLSGKKGAFGSDAGIRKLLTVDRMSVGR
jgi:hypothetical protein